MILYFRFMLQKPVVITLFDYYWLIIHTLFQDMSPAAEDEVFVQIKELLKEYVHFSS